MHTRVPGGFVSYGYICLLFRLGGGCQLEKKKKALLGPIDAMQDHKRGELWPYRPQFKRCHQVCLTVWVTQTILRVAYPAIMITTLRQYYE